MCICFKTKRLKSKKPQIFRLEAFDLGTGLILNRLPENLECLAGWLGFDHQDDDIKIIQVWG